jgi:hypothetical protein
MAPTPDAVWLECLPHLARAIGVPRLLMQDLHLLDEALIGLCAGLRSRRCQA